MNFEELVKKVSPTLKRITYRLNGHFTYFNEQDLYQEALIHLWDDFQAGKLSDKTDSYILQGCYFHLKNYIRKAKDKYNHVSLETVVNGDEQGMCLEEKLSLYAEDTQSPIDYFHNKLLLETIRNNGFTPREKDIINFYALGLTTRKIGQRLGISHVMVVKVTAQIKEKCKKYIEA